MRWLRKAWTYIRRLVAVLAIVRFSLLIPAILALTLVAAEQMVDILQAVGEDGQLGAGAWLLGAAAFAGLTVWYTARTMLRFRFASNRASDPALHPRLKRAVPRLVGVLIPALLAIRVGLLAIASSAAAHLWIFAGALALVAITVALYVAKRRDIAQRTGLRVLAVSEAQEQRNLDRWGQLPATTKRVLYALMISNGLALALFMYTPVYRIGAPAILLLALGLIAVMGSGLVYMANHYAVPVITLLALWTAVWSLTNDNHMVRLTSTSKSHGWFSRAAAPPTNSFKASPLGQVAVKDYFEGWWTDLARDEPSNVNPIPVFVIAAEGGGIRAAYWTAAVLATLEDATATSPVPFSRHVFAISGVSGGSLGAAVFDAVIAHRQHLSAPDQGSRLEEIDRVLSQDFLSPTLGAALFPDLVQRFVPLPILDDRAMALEKSWEQAWARAHPGDRDRFASPFHDLWTGNPHAVPLLFLNSTVVETGQRAIVSPLATTSSEPDETFADALSVGRLIGTQLPLSTATLISARFTYVSPAGLIDTHREGILRWVRVVDGGYFDNSGAVTAQEIVRVIMQTHDGMPSEDEVGHKLRSMNVIVLHLPNEPLNSPSSLVKSSGSITGDEWLEEILSPVRALLATRGARGTQAIGYLHDDPNVQLLTVGPCRLHAGAPLGWVLSGLVRQDFREQLQSCQELGKDCAAERLKVIEHILTGNATTLPPEYRAPTSCATNQ
jgi:hypothetical protein